MSRVPGTGAAKRILVEGTGWLLVLAGIAALALPGPGLLMLFGGMLVLSQQYEWADRRLRPVERRAKMAAADSVQTWPRIVMSSLLSLWLMFLGVLWMVQPPAPDWWPLRDSWWLFGGYTAGVTLLLSGFIAVAMIVYSYRTYRGLSEEEIEEQVQASVDS